ncbi:MAG TPA: glycoside hydrolase family 25 protein [Saprospiraceae bacterium]|jgi:lysozyme|nr:glycoside hydrolase family 25 protein [Saprospiraceae bacterium]MBX7178946.1 glycoside hydrolase family 25 protein [Saprospiraceae bacterium]MCB0589854.1 glycoside hydrolase family 25 protein [Saprospiraceae bacterium]MCO5284301.1 glycoside hydrolase family 25 protein [Saprospiraceae bacterium]MCO6471193.1 glycoside hydrolase family 25 protein [Saprospiraceae bacterium]
MPNPIAGASRKTTRPPVKKRRVKPQKTTSGRLSEKKVIFGTAFLVLLCMISIHLSGCFDELKASKINKSYIKFPEFGIHMPTLYSINGIDVSVHQGMLDWKAIKNAAAGSVKIDFAFIKATEGRTKVDKYFKYNWEQAEKNGLIRGAYHFFLPNKSGMDQARLFLKTVDFKTGDFIPVCDIEITGGADSDMIEQNLRDWLDTVEKEIGKKPILYSSKKFYETYLHQEFSDYPLWIAHYNVPALELKDQNRWLFWQHNDKGKVKGVRKHLDFNVFNGTMDELNLLRL